MLSKEYRCTQCDLRFERTTVDEEQNVRCPVCGQREIELVRSGEKAPESCATSGKFT